MARDLKQLDGWIDEAKWPVIDCPTCNDGFLVEEAFYKVQSGESSRGRDNDNWEPDWTGGTFHGHLKCARADRGETVTVGGDYKVDALVAPNGSWYGHYGDFLRLRFALPSLSLLEIPKGTPANVRSAIGDASQVVWVDPKCRRQPFAVRYRGTPHRPPHT